MEKIAEKIVEILVYTQFANWVEPLPEKATAREVNTQNERAIAYYRDVIKFHTLVNFQAKKIIQAITEKEG